MKVNRAPVLLGLVVLGAAQGCTGCFTDPCAIPRDGGKNGQLNFFVPNNSARGLKTEATLVPRVLTFFENPFTIFTRSPAECFDFEGAEIEVSLPASLQSEPATVIRGGPMQDIPIQFTCGAQAATPQEVGVRVVEGETVRFEDAFDITCRPLAQAAAVLVGEPRQLSGTGYVAGGLLHAELRLSDPGGNELFGFGAASADGMLARVETSAPRAFMPLRETFKILTSGQSPALQLAQLRSDLPATLLPPGAWELKIETERSSPEVFKLSAWPKTFQGEKLNGVEECRWTAFTATDSDVLTDTACDIFHSNTLPGTNRFITQVCVDALGKSACIPMPQ